MDVAQPLDQCVKLLQLGGLARPWAGGPVAAPLINGTNVPKLTSAKTDKLPAAELGGKGALAAIRVAQLAVVGMDEEDPTCDVAAGFIAA